MATPQTQHEPLPNSLSMIRRRLLAAPSDAATKVDARSDTVDFDAMGGNNMLQQELEQAVRDPRGYDEVEDVLKRYQAEKGGAAMPELELRAPTNSVSAGAMRRSQGQGAATAPLNGSIHGEVSRNNAGSRQGLPPLTGNNYSELEKLRAENSELRAMVAELRQYFDETDAAGWEQRLQETTGQLAERDELIANQRKCIEEWQQKLKTNRFVPSDSDLAEMSDELEKERCQIAQDRKLLDTERQQLRDDEASLMNQMREMEVSMARDRADLARQRTELQRLQSEVQHELDIMQRGDASVKDRLAAFQRRNQEVGMRPKQSPTTPLPAAAPMAAPMAAPPSKAPNTGVFKRLFGQSN